MRLFSGTAFLLIFFIASAHSIAAEVEPTVCAVTQPPAEPFNGPYPPPHGQYWYGGEHLAFKLEKDGLWRSHGAKKNYEGDLVVYSDNYFGALTSTPALNVTGKSLSGETAGIKFKVSNHYIGGFGWMMLAKVQFPSAGCWEVSVEYKGTTDTFVTSVEGS